MTRGYFFPWLILSAALVFLAAAPSVAQDSHTQKLIEGAKKEGALMWYTSTSIEDAKALFEGFGRKYPFIKTEFFRAGSARLFNRILNEARAGKVLFDVVAVRGLETHQLVKAGFLQPYISPEAAAYPPGFKDPKGYWVDYFDAYNVIGYNTKLVPKDQAPKNWEDLLDPKWKGKIAMDEEMYSWYGALTQKWGKEKTQRFMKALAKQEIQLRSGQTLIAQLMAAGEFHMGMVLAHRIEKMKEQGAPVEWVTTLDPITVSLHPIGVAARAPHPNAAKLFIDFLLSKDGQQLVLAIDRTPARPGIDTKMEAKKLKLYPVPPELGEHYNQFQKEFREIFR
ncbi:MAG TPA: extracellular solute-binding protein [Candidatus Acidoferrales bacterium]|nr:extracellular solute-binding protein [Candidatus Acidoferrales bacterium]